MTRGTYIGAARVPWTELPVHVYAALRSDFRDDLNDPDQELQTIHHETIRRGDVPFVAVTWEYGTKRELARGGGSGGAGIDAEVIDGLPEDARARARRILELAEAWHLNTMRAGCAHQRVEYETDRYGRRVPSLELTKPCPVTGYRYGSAWLAEVPPPEVLAELRQLFGFPAVSADASA